MLVEKLSGIMVTVIVTTKLSTSLITITVTRNTDLFIYTNSPLVEINIMKLTIRRQINLPIRCTEKKSAAGPNRLQAAVIIIGQTQ